MDGQAAAQAAVLPAAKLPFPCHGMRDDHIQIIILRLPTETIQYSPIVGDERVGIPCPAALPVAGNLLIGHAVNGV
jgi:hypothetical protein